MWNILRINITRWRAKSLGNWKTNSLPRQTYNSRDLITLETLFQTQQNAFGASSRAGAKDHAACNLGMSNRLMAPRKRWNMMFNVYIFLHWFSCSLFMGHVSTGKTVFAFVFSWGGGRVVLTWNNLRPGMLFVHKNIPNILQKTSLEMHSKGSRWKLEMMISKWPISVPSKRQQTLSPGEIRGWSRALLPWNNPVIDLVKLEIERSILGAHLKMSWSKIKTNQIIIQLQLEARTSWKVFK